MKLVLVCDDSVYVRHTLVSMLRKMGLRAILASNGTEGLALIRSFNPGLVICDIDLLEMDGMEMFNAVREDTTLLGLHWIIMGPPSRQKEALATGCVNFLPKPIKSRVLELAVDQELYPEVKQYA